MSGIFKRWYLANGLALLGRMYSGNPYDPRAVRPPVMILKVISPATRPQHASGGGTDGSWSIPSTQGSTHSTDSDSFRSSKRIASS
jgi:hypothetical protein